jgi:hypothetical protein
LGSKAKGVGEKHKMRNGQNKQRMRNRGGGGGHNNNNNNNRRGQNPLTRVYESNGPEIKIRGTASHITEKYLQLARDAQGSGDPVAAENYYQHAEHYFRIIAAAQEQFRQNQPQQPPRMDNDTRDEGTEETGGEYAAGFNGEAGQPREQQPYPIREPQPPYPARDQQPREQGWRDNRNPSQPSTPTDDSDIDRLPSFITGGQPQPNFGAGSGFDNSTERPNGAERGDRGDRYPHRRRRRHHGGPRPEGQGAPVQGDDFGSGSSGD